MEWLKSEIKLTLPSDPLDIRLASLVSKNLDSGKIQIWGYPDDEGIWLNGGRPGARHAPDVIRQHLYKMTPDSAHWKAIFDSGNLSTKSTLEKRHETALINAKSVTAKNVRWISLGGGHDYGYSDSAGFLEGLEKTAQKPLIINFDAHLDVRPVIGNSSLNSGTPFFRLLTRKDLNFDFYEVGLQPQCNSIQHRKWALTHGVHLIDLSEIRKSTLTQSLKKALGENSLGNPLFLSIDIDAFSSAIAPGCSQSWATGFNIEEFLEAFSWLSSNYDLRALGIYEVSPPLDVQNQTSKLAALICYQTLKVFNGR